MKNAPCSNGVTKLTISYEKNVTQNQNFLDEKTGIPSHAHTHARAHLDTLAQLRTLVDKNLNKRCKAKWITLGYLYDLIDLNSSLKNSYWNSFHCVEHLILDVEQKKLTGKYCNNRWCLVCNRIRTAKLMNGYIEQIKKFNDKTFLTLTVPNVPGDKLEATIMEMGRNFRKILDASRGRKNKIIIDGIRKNECTYNDKRNDFHPHYHCIIDGRDKAEHIQKEWLKRYPEANIKAQDIRPANEKSIIELFKYFTKIVSRGKKGKKEKNIYPVYIDALDVINRAFYRRRVFQTFGTVKLQSEDIEEIQAEQIENVFDGCVWEWVQDQSTWVSEYGELLTDNNYSQKLKVHRLRKTNDGYTINPEGWKETGKRVEENIKKSKQQKINHYDRLDYYKELSKGN